MIAVTIWEAGECSHKIRNILENDYNPAAEKCGAETLTVIGYVQAGAKAIEDSLENEMEILNLGTFLKAYKTQKVSTLILPIDCFIGNNGLLLYLIENGVNLQDVYLFQRLAEYDSENVLDAVEPYISSGYLPYLEFHAADHCNLNCVACEHYSPLVKEPAFPEKKEFALGFSRLKELVNDIGMIRILGGEPLLNPDLDFYMEYVRKLYPKAKLYLVTNGALLLNMPEHFYEKLLENHVIIYISQYPALQDKLTETVAYLEQKKIPYELSEPVEYFGVRQKLEPSEKMGYFYRCLQARCNFFYGHSIGACYMPFLTKYFNEFFAEELSEPLPEDGAIDLLDEKLTTELLKIRLLMPFERCRYCIDARRVDWKVLGKKSCLQDWIIK